MLIAIDLNDVFNGFLLTEIISYILSGCIAHSYKHNSETWCVWPCEIVKRSGPSYHPWCRSSDPTLWRTPACLCQHRTAGRSLRCSAPWEPGGLWAGPALSGRDICTGKTPGGAFRVADTVSPIITWWYVFVVITVIVYNELKKNAVWRNITCHSFLEYILLSVFQACWTFYRMNYDFSYTDCPDFSTCLWDAGPSVQTASAQGRCTCGSSSQSLGPRAQLDGLLHAAASHSHRASVPVEEHIGNTINQYQFHYSINQNILACFH